MIKLEIPRKDELHLSLVDKLTELALAHQVRINKSLKEAVLSDGDTVMSGTSAIQHYLEELKQELHSWWYCAC
ncbi:MAG: hypothetical protein R2795_08955 [Saprospiraceae bacterium]